MHTAQRSYEAVMSHTHLAENGIENDYERKYQAAFGPVYEDRGTQYHCKQEVIERIDAFRTVLQPNLGPFTTPVKAAEEITEWNHHPPASDNYVLAITRLRDAVGSVRLGHQWMPDLIIKMFADIDIVFFSGRLLGNVCVT